MRKILIATFAITTLLYAPSATASIKAGETCKKVGQTSITNGKRFTCVKSGKKTVWDKGVIQSAQSTESRPVSQPAQSPQANTAEFKEGDKCNKLGDATKTSLGNLECRDVVNNSLIWVNITTNSTSSNSNSSPEDVSICKLQDQRTQKTPGQGIAFPINDRAFSSIGEVRTAIIPIDFPDAPGEEGVSQLIADNVKKIDSWVAFSSGGKQKYKWSNLNEWSRAPKNSDQYNWLNPGLPRGVQVLSDTEIANQLFSVVSNKLDLTKLDYVFLLFPKNEQGIQGEIAGRSRQVNTPQGQSILSYFGAGKYFYETNQELWRVWVHEALHSQGLAMHAPGNGSPLHIGGNQSGASSVLSGWDQFISEWIPDSQVYCIQKTNVNGQKVSLSSIDNPGNGTKIAIVKISQKEAIVVESRRRGVFSQGFPAGTYGLNVYVLQAAQDNERCDACDQDAVEKKQFAYYLRADGVERGNFNFPLAAPIRWSVFVRQGESVSYSGLKISLDKTGELDTISISK